MGMQGSLLARATSTLIKPCRQNMIYPGDWYLGRGEWEITPPNFCASPFARKEPSVITLWANVNKPTLGLLKAIA